MRGFIPLEEKLVLNWGGGNNGSYVSWEVTLKGLVPQGNPVFGSKDMAIDIFTKTPNARRGRWPDKIISP